MEIYLNLLLSRFQSYNFVEIVINKSSVTSNYTYMRTLEIPSVIPLNILILPLHSINVKIIRNQILVGN